MSVGAFKSVEVELVYTLRLLSDVRTELGEALMLLGEAKAEVVAQAEFHGCDNCNLTSMDVVKRIDAMLTEGTSVRDAPK